MTRAQKESLRDAIIADLEGKPVQWRFADAAGSCLYDDVWQDAFNPQFKSSHSNGRPLEWRPKPPEPQPVFKRWGAVNVQRDLAGVWEDKSLAEKAAISMRGDLIELTETSRVSFADKPREPMRIVSVVALDGALCGFAWDAGFIGIAHDWARRNGGRVAEFVEVVKP